MVTTAVYMIIDMGYSKRTKEKTKDSMEYYIIPAKNNKHMIYFPRKGMLSLVNKEFINKINTNDHLVKNLLNFISKQKNIRVQKLSTFKSDITLELTTDCNLNCIYCYANGGDNPKYMDWETAKSAIDFGIKQCKNNNFSITFYGNGEQMLAFPMMKKSYEYAKKKCDKRGIKIESNTTTNGTIMTEEMVKWFKKNKIQLTISFDGTPEIQNKQRPFRNGNNSYNQVKNTIRLLNKIKVKYDVNVCITKKSIPKMIHIINNLHRLGIKYVIFSRINEIGRCKKTDTKTPEAINFLKKYKIASVYAKRKNIVLVNNSIHNTKNDEPLELRNYRCHASGYSLNITADGNLTSCPFVTNKRDPAAKIFFYGKIKDGKFIFDQKKLEYLRKRTVSNMPQCKDCFAKYYCLGECPLEIFRHTGSIFKPFEKQCLINKNKFKNALFSIIK